MPQPLHPALLLMLVRVSDPEALLRDDDANVRRCKCGRYEQPSHPIFKTHLE